MHISVVNDLLLIAYGNFFFLIMGTQHLHVVLALKFVHS